jgi:hypothetical protein|tara:strand:+ start:432 stop:533 length:102 start_codon:yes stop_codon:yes gene_type:complete
MSEQNPQTGTPAEVPYQLTLFRTEGFLRIKLDL